MADASSAPNSQGGRRFISGARANPATLAGRSRPLQGARVSRAREMQWERTVSRWLRELAQPGGTGR